MKEKHIFMYILRALNVLFWIVFAGLFIYFSFKLAYPFIIAAILAILLNPIVNLLTKKLKIPRGLSVLLSILFLFGVIGSILLLLILKIIEGIEYLSKKIPDNIETLMIYTNELLNQNVLPLWEEVQALFNRLSDQQQITVQENIQNFGLELASYLGKLGQGLANGLSNILSSLPMIVIAFIFILIALYFISKDWYQLQEFTKRIIPDKVYEKWIPIQYELKTKVLGFFMAQLVLMSLTFVAIIIGLLILRVPNAFTIAAIAAFLDFLPYLGVGAIFVPWIIYCFVTGNYFLAFGLLILYVFVHLQRHFAEPKVLSSNLGLNPLATLISLFVGLQLFGFMGLFIGPVILVIFKALMNAGVIQEITAYIKGNEQ